MRACIVSLSFYGTPQTTEILTRPLMEILLVGTIGFGLLSFSSLLLRFVNNSEIYYSYRNNANLSWHSLAQLYHRRIISLIQKKAYLLHCLSAHMS